MLFEHFHIWFVQILCGSYSLLQLWCCRLSPCVSVWMSLWHPERKQNKSNKSQPFLPSCVQMLVMTKWSTEKLTITSWFMGVDQLNFIIICMIFVRMCTLKYLSPHFTLRPVLDYVLKFNDRYKHKKSYLKSELSHVKVHHKQMC